MKRNVAISLLILLSAVWLDTSPCCGEAGLGGAPVSQRKALMMGRGNPYREPNGGPTHPEYARQNFLNIIGNPNNDPAKGWTCDMEWDLKVRYGMDPTNTPAETLFRYLGEHRLGYRIAMNAGPQGATAAYWGAAVDNGIMPFAPQGNNNPGFRFDDPIGLRAAVGVAGGSMRNITSVGPGVEFIDGEPVWVPPEQAHELAQSWANQATSARFARVLDEHPNYNIWDAREHLRQAGSFWARGWTETNGYGRVTYPALASKLLPGPPVDFSAEKSRDRRRVFFSWRNFLQSDFAATVITRKDGRIIYEGRGTNLVWTSDIDGDETFTYWSKNKAGEKSRIESYQRRTIPELNFRVNRTCLVLGAPAKQEGLSTALYNRFQELAPDWNCDLIYQPGNAYYDHVSSFPAGAVVAVLAGVPAMVDFAISNHYRLLLSPITFAENDLYRFKSDWERATAAGVLVVLPHHSSLSFSRKPQARRLSPPRLFAAITVGAGVTNNLRSFGPGLEFFDAPATPSPLSPEPLQPDAAAVVAAKLARIFDANPAYNLWDARQHLRQSASYYREGWREDGGYGRPAATPVKIDKLDPAPPVEIQALKSPDGTSIAFSWENFLETHFAETVIKRGNGAALYHGTGTSFNWISDVDGEETFSVFSKDKEGRLSRAEAYTTFTVSGLRRK